MKLNLFQISRMFLLDPAVNLPEKVKADLVKATIRYFEPKYAIDVLERETIRRTLKHMRRSLIAGEIRQMSAWIEKSGIRRDWPELPEDRIRRIAVHALFTAYRNAESIADFRKHAPFYVEQSLRKVSCNSPHCHCFRLSRNERSR